MNGVALRLASVLAFVAVICEVGLGDEIVLKSGIKIPGKIVQADSTNIVVETAAGKTISYKRSDVAEMRSSEFEELDRADKLLKAGKMREAEKVFEGLAQGGGLVRSDAQKRLMECAFVSEQFEKGTRLYLALLNSDPGPDIAGGFPWHRASAGNAGAIGKGIAAAGQVTGIAAEIAELLRRWVKCTETPATDPKSALAALLDSKESLVSDTTGIVLIRILVERKDYDGALALIEKQMPKLGGLAQAWAGYWKGECLLQKGDVERAALAFLRIGLIGTGPSALTGDSLFMAAVCFEKKHQSERARDIYREIAEEHPLALSSAEARKKSGLGAQ